MNKDIRRGVGRWIAAISGILVAFKALSVLVRKVIRVASGEAQARGSDVAFVLGAAERGRARVRP
jgi:hypothetical protein